MWPMMHGYGWSFGWFGWLIILLFWIGIGLLIWFIVRTAVSRGGGDTPLDILKRRYARGEITREEYERMKKELES